MSTKKKTGHLMYSLIGGKPEEQKEEAAIKKNRFQEEAAEFKEEMKAVETPSAEMPTAEKESEIEDKKTPEQAEQPVEKKNTKIIIPPQNKKEVQTKARIVRFTPSFNAKLEKELKKKGMSFNYLVTQLLDIWMDNNHS